MGSQRLPGQPGRFGQPDEIMRRIERLEANMRELGPSIAKSFAGTVATLQQTVDDVAQAQDTLTAQQATLSNAVDDINRVIDEQVQMYCLDDGANSFPLPTNTGTIIHSKSVPVPAGFTRCGILVVGTLTAHNLSGLPEYLRIGVSINGSVDIAGVWSQWTPNDTRAVVVNHEAQDLTGLTPGSSIDIDIYGGSSGTSWGTTNALGISVLAVFAR